MPPPRRWVSLRSTHPTGFRRNDVIDGKTQAALSQIGREEKAAAADEVSPIVRHRASVAQQRVMGFAEPVIGPARGPHRARAMGLPHFGPDPLAQPILRAATRFRLLADFAGSIYPFQSNARPARLLRRLSLRVHMQRRKFIAGLGAAGI